jgi:hypothetical protein
MGAEEAPPVTAGAENFEEVKRDTRVYPKVYGLAAWSENCK